MANHNVNTGISSGAINTSGPEHIAAPIRFNTGRLYLPLCYTGGDLGLGNRGEPDIEFRDAAGNEYTTSSVEWCLQKIDCFMEGRSQVQLLAGAALHYGLGAHALMGADLDNIPKWDVCDGTGRVLLAGATHSDASIAAEEFTARDGWEADIHIKRQRRANSASDPRHEGQLVLLHHNLGVTTFTGVAVKSHAGRCGMMLEEVLWRFEQFSEADQAELMRGLAQHFDLRLAQRELVGAA